MMMMLVCSIDDGNDDCGGICKFRSGLPLLQLLHQHSLIPSSIHTINKMLYVPLYDDIVVPNFFASEKLY